MTAATVTNDPDTQSISSDDFQSLIDQVLSALWRLLLGFQAAADSGKAPLFAEAVDRDPQHAYEGILTTIFRVVFTLYAEANGMMPVGDFYQENRSIENMATRCAGGASPWGELLKSFQLTFYGEKAAEMSAQARGGNTFSPSVFPFIEDALIDDEAVLSVLSLLSEINGERVFQYQNLEVEKIGSIYEVMLGFAIERAKGPSLGVKPSGGKSPKLKGHIIVDLQQLADLPGSKRKGWLKKNAVCTVTGNPAKSLAKAETSEEIALALAGKISQYTPEIIQVGSLYLQPSEERRKTGSHYTPRELIIPVVKTTLRPIIEQMGEHPRAEQILKLKVCDPAMGSGAFLIEVCRQLSGSLLDAWKYHESEPASIDCDLSTLAMQLVAKNCVYGVDRNPFAVDLAKLSLWLATSATHDPFTFVDDHLKCGDALVGLTKRQIELETWGPVDGNESRQL